MAQFARPDSNITQTAMTGGFSNIDETTASDSDIAWSTDGSDAELEVGLSNVTDPSLSSGHVIRYRVAKTDDGVASDTGNAKQVTVRLMQGATQIAADSAKTLTGTWTTYTRALSSAEADAITDYTDLRLEFVSAGGGGNPSNRRGMGISWAELEVPAVSNDKSGSGSTSATTGATAAGGKAASGTASTSATSATSASGSQPGGITSADVGLQDAGGSTDRPWRTLFLHDGKWFGLLQDSAVTNTKGIWRRDASGDWNDAAAAYTFGGNAIRVDAVDDGTNLYVSRLSTTAAHMRRFSYTAGTQTWANDYSTAATFYNPDKYASTALDSSGRVWTFFIDNTTGDLKYEVTLQSDGSAVQAATTLVSGLSTVDFEQMIACSFNDGDASIGVAFSDHVTMKTRFLHRHDADAVGTWQTEETIDASETDDHIDIAVDDDQNIWVHYKTTIGDLANELRLSRRDAATGTWSTPVAATEDHADGHTRPRIVVDEHGRAYLFAIHQASGSLHGDVVVRVVEADMTIGAEQTVISGDYNDISGTSSVATESSGVLVIAREQSTTGLWEGYVPVAAASSGVSGTGSTSATTGATASGTKDVSGAGSVNSGDGMLGTGAKVASGTGAISATTGGSQSGAKSASGIGSASATTDTTASGVAAESHGGTGSTGATVGVVATGTPAMAGTGSVSSSASPVASGAKASSGAGSAEVTVGETRTGTKAASGIGSTGLTAGLTASGTTAESHEGTGSTSATTGITGTGSRQTTGTASTSANHDLTPVGQKNAAGTGSAAPAAGIDGTGSKAASGTASEGLVADLSASGTASTAGSGSGSTSASVSTTASGSRQASGAGSASASSGVTGSGARQASGVGATGVGVSMSATGTAGESTTGTGSMAATTGVTGSGAKGASGPGSDMRTSDFVGTGTKGALGSGSASLAADPQTSGTKAGSGGGTSDAPVSLTVTGSKWTSGSALVSLLSALVATGAQPREIEAVAVFAVSLEAAGSLAAAMDAAGVLARSLAASQSAAKSIEGAVSSAESLDAAASAGVT